MEINYDRLNKLLLHYTHVLHVQETDEQCYEILVGKIMPLLARHPLCTQWIQKREEHIQRRSWLEGQVLRELKSALNVIKEQLIAKGLLKEAAIKRRICIIESILGFRFHCRDEHAAVKNELICSVCGASEVEHRVYVFPSYVFGVHEELEKLCHETIALRQEVLLKNYVEIKYSLEYAVDPTIFQRYYCIDCRYLYDRSSAPQNLYGEPMPFEGLIPEWVCPKCAGEQANFLPIDSGLSLSDVPYIDSFNLAPSFIELTSMDNMLALKSRNEPDSPIWAVYETLFTIEWAWRTSRDFLRKKELWYNNIKECARSRQLLEFNDLKIEKRAITKKQQCYLYPAVCTRERIAKSLDVILKEIGIACADDGQELLNDMIFPMRVELVLPEHDIELLLKVEWMNGLIEVCRLHKFQEPRSTQGNDLDNNHMEIFIRNLLKAPHKSINVSLADGANAKKYLKRAGISGVLGELFVARKSIDSARLRDTQINLTEKPIWTLRKLSHRISKLETERWEPELQDCKKDDDWDLS